MISRRLLGHVVSSVTSRVRGLGRRLGACCLLSGGIIGNSSKGVRRITHIVVRSRRHVHRCRVRETGVAVLGRVIRSVGLYGRGRDCIFRTLATGVSWFFEHYLGGSR